MRIEGHHLNNLGSTQAPELNTNFQRLWSVGSAAEDFKGFLQYIGVEAILVL